MTNDVYTFELTRTEPQTLRVSLPITFPITQCDANGPGKKCSNEFAAHCIVSMLAEPQEYGALYV